MQEFSKLFDKETYYKSKYCKEAALISNDFLKIYVEPNEKVINLIITERLKEVNENRERYNLSILQNN